MNLVWHTDATPITHDPGGGAFTFTPVVGAPHRLAWERCRDWLLLKSARFRAMMADFAAYGIVNNAYIMFSEDLEIGGGKFFTDEETNQAGWGALRGMPVAVVKIKVCPIVTFDMNGDHTTPHFASYVGENSDFFGHMFAAGLERNPVPNGWTKAGARRSRDEMAQCMRSPLILLAHELGHLWQWITWKNGYNAVKAIAEENDPTGATSRNAVLRIELNNIINNEAPIAYELGESVRFNYYSVRYVESDYAYNLPPAAHGTNLPMVFSGDDRDWPSSAAQARVYDSCQIPNLAYNGAARLLELTPEYYVF